MLWVQIASSIGPAQISLQEPPECPHSALDWNRFGGRFVGVSHFQIRSPQAAISRPPNASHYTARTQTVDEKGEPLVAVDLRLEVERQDDCIPEALAVAFEDLDSLLPAIANKEVVFYCSCPDEIRRARAALRLKRHGITHLHALLGGFSAWRELGFPVDTPFPGVARVRFTRRACQSTGALSKCRQTQAGNWHSRTPEC